MSDHVYESDFRAFVALDWADQQHAFALEDAASGERQSSVLAHTPEAVQAWAAELIARFGPAPIAVCLEQSRGALVSMLLQFENFVIYPVPPQSAGKRFTARGRKTIRATPSCCSISCNTIGGICGRSRPTRPRSASCSCWWPTGGIWSTRRAGRRTA